MNPRSVQSPAPGITEMSGTGRRRNSGGSGDLAFFYRHERAARIYDGPDEVQKLSLAKRLLGEYRAQ